MFASVFRASEFRRFRQSLAAVLLSASALSTSVAIAQGEVEDDVLIREFRDPPQSARPRVWWHWMNGNISEDGIVKDLSWMHRVGIGGVQAFDAAIVTPKIVENRLVYMTPEWRDAFKLAASTADDLGLELAIAASPGWSETGGPWVRPGQAMKKLVWSEREISGGRAFSGRLAMPPRVSGPFQDRPVAANTASLLNGGETFEAPDHYSDVRVLAFPVGRSAPPATPRISIDGQELDAAALFDASLVSAIAIKDGKSPILIDYARPQAIRSATIFIADQGSLSGARTLPVLEASADGRSWTAVAELPLGAVPTTVSFPTVKARHFRVTFKAPQAGAAAFFAPAPGADMSLLAQIMPPPGPMQVAQLTLSPDERINRYEVKAGFGVAPDYAKLDDGILADGAAIDTARVIDLTGRMAPDGKLNWMPPKGRWRLVRFGYSLTGTTNHPATPEATGLEVDKLDGSAVRSYMERYIENYRKAVGADLIGRRGVRAMVNDSIETGPANWTPRLIEEFTTRRGYDPVPFLPTLTGVIVGSRAKSNAFLYDFRRTLADLIAKEHYGTIVEVLHENGLQSYQEALEGGRPVLGNDIEMRSHADIPMAAIWVVPSGKAIPSYQIGDLRGAASTGHIYGRAYVAAESLTSAMQPWAHAPADLRPVMDFAFIQGVNRPIIHTSVHQPSDDKVPGLSLFMFGQYFNRHETWAEMARPWVDYIARSSYLLQQGRNSADVAYFYGEDRPLTVIFEAGAPKDLPSRYAYDFINGDALQNATHVEGGEIVTTGGARYKVLYLGNGAEKMTLPLLRRVAELFRAGATIVGNPPSAMPALMGDAAEHDLLVREIWTPAAGRKAIPGSDVEAALASVGIVPDFSYVSADADSQILFTHRKLSDGEIYFLSNRQNVADTVEATFRVTGKLPEIWRADTNTIEPVSYRIDRDRTVVPLTFAAQESYFVVFRKAPPSPAITVAAASLVQVASLAGAWKVSFQEHRGAPAGLDMPSLGSLTDQKDSGVKYFSGVATYRKSFDLPRGIVGKPSLVLDLGAVGDVASVVVNGKTLGTVWHAPYRLDVASAVHPGRNSIEIQVANLWVNRLIGDAQPGGQKITYTANATYRPSAPLRPSGLIGPVRILAPVQER